MEILVYLCYFVVVFVDVFKSTQSLLVCQSHLGLQIHARSLHPPSVTRPNCLSDRPFGNSFYICALVKKIEILSKIKLPHKPETLESCTKEDQEEEQR